MKNIYLVQINDFYGSGRKSTYIPYAAGCIQAYCMQDEAIAGACRFGRIVYCRDKIPAIAGRLTDPFMVLFSCSVWNTEFNKALAAALKEEYPACYVVFGGHHVSSDRAFLDENPAVDFVIHNGGEEPAAALLKCLLQGRLPENVPNLSYRRANGEAVTNPILPQTGSDYPSPYLTGVFDEILTDDVDFSVILETNRGCPNSCSFCDWGQLKSKVRLFPLERVFAEIDWFAAHKIEYVYCADANFCLFSRDEQIVDYVVNSNKTRGYPKIFHVNFTKNRTDFVFDISTRMIRNGLAKAQTVAFQSMDPTVLENIGRKNMSPAHFRSLMRRFNENHIATYSELILGLPGETYQSFCRGMCSLIENGQHFAVYVYPCEIFPNSELAQKAYRERFAVGSTRVPFLLMHTSAEPDPGAVTEYVELLTSTYSMDRTDWARTFLFASFVQGLHNLGLTRCVAIYLRHARGFGYDRFYEGLLGYAESRAGAFLHSLYTRILDLCTGTAEGRNSFVAPAEGTDNILWGFEELVYIEVFRRLNDFYAELKTWVTSLFGADDTLEALFRYQYDVVKKIGVHETDIVSDYDFYSYFAAVCRNDPQPLRKKKIRLHITDPHPAASFADYAREAVWYGRNRQETDYTSYVYPVRFTEEPDASVGDPQ